jgi:hypothetical protein
VDGGTFGHDVFSGRWHGSVVIHTFKLADNDDVATYLVRVAPLVARGQADQMIL